MISEYTKQTLFIWKVQNNNPKTYNISIQSLIHVIYMKLLLQLIRFFKLDAIYQLLILLSDEYTNSILAFNKVLLSNWINGMLLNACSDLELGWSMINII